MMGHDFLRSDMQSNSHRGSGSKDHVRRRQQTNPTPGMRTSRIHECPHTGARVERGPQSRIEAEPLCASALNLLKFRLLERLTSVTSSSTLPPGRPAPHSGVGYTAALAAASTVFFMWGFVTVLNDILVPHLKAIFQLNYAQTMLIQFTFFSAYFLLSLPAAKILSAIGYHRAIVLGLAVMSAGALLFVPAASYSSYGLFLGG